MLNVSATTRVFVAVAPVDLRGSFNRLFALTQSVLQQDALSGHWFVFSNRSRNRVKILFWDGSGLWVCANKHAPHCSLRFVKTSLPVPSFVRDIARSVRCCRGRAGFGVCPASEQHNSWFASVDV